MVVFREILFEGAIAFFNFLEWGLLKKNSEISGLVWFQNYHFINSKYLNTLFLH